MSEARVVELKDTEARGRHGWFKGREARLRRVDESRYGGVVRLYLDIVSKRPAYPGPVHLEMSPEDARAMAEALVEQSEKIEEEIGEREQGGSHVAGGEAAS